jgi:hypothetical protein
MGSARPARRLDALRALGDGLSRSAFAVRAPSVRFRVPSEVLRGTPAPSGRSCDRASDDSHFHGLSCRTTHAGAAVARDGRGSAPPASHVRGFDPHRGDRHRPSRRLATSERPSACLLEAFSSCRSDTLPGVHSLLSFLTSVRSLLREAVGRGRLQGVDLDTNTFGPPSPARTNPRDSRCVVASTRFTPLELSLPASWRHALVACAPRSRSDRSTSRPICVFGSFGSPESVRPSRGHRLVRGSSPCDRRGFVPTGVGSELMNSPRESCALHAARSTTSSLTSGPAEGVPRPEPAVLG